jgi:dihydroneopterin aldolase
MDIIFLRGLHIETIIGIFDWERASRQTIVVDLEMATDNRKAAASDAIEDALDYGKVAGRVIEFVEASDFFLVETLAERICAIIREEFKVPWVRLTLNKKGAIERATDVGVIIERGEKPGHG